MGINLYTGMIEGMKEHLFFNYSQIRGYSFPHQDRSKKCILHLSVTVNGKMNMNRMKFNEDEIPYDNLANFDLSKEMIEDLPLSVLQRISNGHRSPVLPIQVEDDSGNIYNGRTRFQLVRNEIGNVNIVYFPKLLVNEQIPFNDEQRIQLNEGKVIIAPMIMQNEPSIMAYHQIDMETLQVLSVPMPVIGKNLQILTDDFRLNNAEENCLKNGNLLTISLEEEVITIGIDLNNDKGIHLCVGNEQIWKEQSRKDWNKHNYGCFGCWTMDDEGNLDYISEEDYTEEMWDEMKKNGAMRKAQAPAYRL